MADGDINLAALWVPVVPETSQFGPKMEEAAKESKRRWNDAFKDFGKGINDDLDKIGSKAKDTFGGVGRSITDSFKKSGQDAANQFVAGLQDSKGKVGGIGKELGDALGTEVGKRLGDEIQKRLPTTAKFYINDIVESFQGINKAIGDAKVNDFQGALEGAAKTLRENINPLTKHIGIDVSGWADKLGGFADKLDGVSGHLQGVNKLAGDVGVDISSWTNPLQAVSDKSNNIKGQVSDIAGLFKGMPGLIGTVGTAISDLAGPIAIAAAGVWEVFGPGGALDKAATDFVNRHPTFMAPNSPIQGPPIAQTPAPQMPLPGAPQPAAPPPGAPPGVKYDAKPGSLDPFAGLLPPGMAPPPRASASPGIPNIAPPDMPDDAKPPAAPAPSAPPAPRPSAPMPSAGPSSFVSPSGGGTDWNALAQAESSGNWHNADTGGSGHYGGLQFDIPTWNEFGGQQFESRPDLATPEQQLAVANRVPPSQRPQRWAETWWTQKGGGGSAGVGSAPSMPNAGMPSRHVGSDQGLTPASIAAKNAIASMFPEVTDIGGWRPPDGFNEHSSGQALDVMIPGAGTPQGKALGDQIKDYVLSHSGELGVDYALWQQRQWNPGGTSSGMENRGSPTQNHMDHVHIHTRREGGTGSVIAGRVPTGAVDSPIYVAPANTSSSSAGSWSQAMGGGSSPKQDIAQQFGSGFLKGIFSDLGFGNVLGGKSPLDFGALKLFSGVASMGMGQGMGGGGSSGMGSGFLSGLGGINLPKMIAGAPHGASAGVRPGFAAGGLVSYFAGGGDAVPNTGIHKAFHQIGTGWDWAYKNVLTPAGHGGKWLWDKGRGNWEEHFDPHHIPEHTGKETLGHVVLDAFSSALGSATGGPIHRGGPSGTDTVPAWLSPGEFVMQRSAVDQYGSGMMSAINAGRFASGGTIPLGPSGVSRVPVGAGAPASVSAHAVYDNRIVLNNVALTDPNQLVRPLQEQMNARTYQRAGAAFTGGGLPYVTGPGGG